jgi:hypothetical protein
MQAEIAAPPQHIVAAAGPFLALQVVQFGPRAGPGQSRRPSPPRSDGAPGRLGCRRRAPRGARTLARAMRGVVDRRPAGARNRCRAASRRRSWRKNRPEAAPLAAVARQGGIPSLGAALGGGAARAGEDLRAAFARSQCSERKPVWLLPCLRPPHRPTPRRSPRWMGWWSARRHRYGFRRCASFVPFGAFLLRVFP